MADYTWQLYSLIDNLLEFFEEKITEERGTTIYSYVADELVEKLSTLVNEIDSRLKPFFEDLNKGKTVTAFYTKEGEKKTENVGTCYVETYGYGTESITIYEYHFKKI